MNNNNNMTQRFKLREQNYQMFGKVSRFLFLFTLIERSGEDETRVVRKRVGKT